MAAPAKRRDALSRARLLDQVASGFERSRITLISAPAGAGKTSLLAELPYAFPKIRLAWLLLDASDNDPNRIAAALLASFSAAGLAPADIAPGDPRGVVTSIVNHVENNSRERSNAVVLDDVHTIAEASVLELLDYFADRLPSNLHLILASRQDPSLSLARRRARGEVNEIRMPALSFTEQETAALANDCLGLNLSSEEVNLLQSRTEGWAAGLRLMATSLSSLPADRLTLLRNGMRGTRRIFDFLAEEVLDRQSPALRNFLLETSILHSLRPPVCDTLTNRRDSAGVLEDLYRRNLYVVASDEAETTFRYHDLFADFLRGRLRHERRDEWVPLHRRAALAETSPEYRVHHLLAAEVWDDAAAEIERTGFDFARRGFAVTVRRWIDELPAEVRDRHPRVLHLLANVIWMQQEFALAQPHLKAALEGYRRQGDTAGQGEVLAALGGTAIMFNRFEEAGDLLAEALTYDVPAPTSLLIHASSLWQSVHSRRTERAREQFDRVFRLLEDGLEFRDPLACNIVLWSVAVPGYLSRIENLAALIRARNPTGLAQACAYTLFAYVNMHRGNAGELEAELNRAAGVAGKSGHVAMMAMAHDYGRIVLGVMRGDWPEVRKWTGKLLDSDEFGLRGRNWRLLYSYYRARACWHSGDLEGLRDVYEDSVQPNPAEVPGTLPYRFMIAGIYALAGRAYSKAEEAFREALRQEDVFLVTRATCSARTFLAYTLLSRGHLDEAMEAFRPFLDEANGNDAPGFLMRDNPFIVSLLRLAHERKSHRPFVERVLHLLGSPLDAVAAATAGGESLSERELEVLRVLAEGLSNKEIAQRLFVSEATVKTHVQHIMQKLTVRSRTEAAARGRALMLL